MEARPPDSEHIIPRRILMSRANQLAQEPESQGMMALSGSRGDSSQATRCGLIGLALASARSSSKIGRASWRGRVYKMGGGHARNHEAAATEVTEARSECTKTGR